MTTISLRITGLNRLVRNLKHSIEDKNMYDLVLYNVAQKTYVYAKQNAAVDTGELEDSIFYNQQGDDWVVGATAEHAQYNEYGSWNIPKGGRVSKSGKVAYTPFLRPAAHKAIKEAGKQFSKELRTRWK